MNEQQQWYVTIAGNAVGPVSTDLVLRGIKHKKIATEAYVCVVGASEWQALTDVPEFHGALAEHGLLPPTFIDHSHTSGSEQLAARTSNPGGVNTEQHDDDSEATGQFSSREPFRSARGQEPAETPAEPATAEPATTESAGPEGETFPSPEAVGEHYPAHSQPYLPPQSEPTNGKHATGPGTPAPGIDVDIDVHITVDEPEAPAIDWKHGFAEYFLVDADVVLPDAQLLLRSLATTPHDTFLHDEPMWNLALCLAFGSNAVASLAADVFFDVVATHGQHERIEWIARTLLSRGFMPSGIPHAAGNRGIGRLRQACPDDLRLQLESQLGI